VARNPLLVGLLGEEAMAVHPFAICLAACCLLCGCGGDPLGRYAVSGTVKVDGAPLTKGNISFQPTENQPTSSGAVVAGGRFSIPREAGLTAGKYRVVVNAAVPGTAGKVIPEDAQPGDPPPPAKEMIPPDWNVSSQHVIEVKREGPFVFPFEIATKGK
jgi:hypothetical protein